MLLLINSLSVSVRHNYESLHIKCVVGSSTKAIHHTLMFISTFIRNIQRRRMTPSTPPQYAYITQKNIPTSTKHWTCVMSYPHDSLPNCEQRTLTRDDKCQGSTDTPYKTKRWEHKAVSAEMATHWCPDTHVLCTNHM